MQNDVRSVISHYAFNYFLNTDRLICFSEFHVFIFRYYSAPLDKSCGADDCMASHYSAILVLDAGITPIACKMRV